MSLLRIDPFRSFEALARRMDGFSSNLQHGITIENGGFNPRVDISEDESKINVHVELAGLKKDEVKISVNDENLLSISGERKRKEEHEDKNFWRSEISFGSFKRQFLLPELADSDNISAVFLDGILDISIPKKEPEAPKNKEINIL